MSLQFNLQSILALLLGVYLFAESLGAMLKMTRQDGSLHVAKYCFTALVGIWMCIDAILAQVDWLVIAQGAALASFIARRLLWRLGQPVGDARQAQPVAPGKSS